MAPSAADLQFESTFRGVITCRTSASPHSNGFRRSRKDWCAICACAGRSRKPACPTREKLLGPGEQNSPAHRAVQPFGQVPVYEEDGLTLFETGSIVMHIAREVAGAAANGRRRRARERITWMFAALNSVEPHVQNLTTIDLFFANEEWAKQRRAGAEKMAKVAPRRRRRLTRGPRLSGSVASPRPTCS